MVAAPPEIDRLPWAVYELFNISLREIYLGVTQLPLHEQFERISRNPPAILGRWKIAPPQVTIREVVSFAKSADAMKFLTPYSKELSMPIWRVFAETAPGTPPPASSLWNQGPKPS